MSDANEMDDLIKAAAAAYNVPRTIPRDEMWAVIEAAQSKRAADQATAPKLYVVPPGVAASDSIPGASSVSHDTSTKSHRVTWWAMAAAATVLIATGVGIGRWTTTGGNGGRNQPAASVAAATIVPPAIVSPIDSAIDATSDGERSSFPAEVREATGNNARSSLPVRALSSAPRGTRAVSAPVLRALSTDQRRDSERRGTVPPGSQSAIPYQVATIRHLTDAEALLTSFNLESRDQRTDSRLAGWAKGLLSNTRLLLDSPAGDDPRRAELLEDLELVLAQIVQLSPGAAAQERDLIDGSIRNGAVMTRLRTAIPAGPTRGF